MKSFEDYFGTGGEPVRLFFAPGRVNLIGEHTDYTGGYVFPATLQYGTWVAVRAREDRTFRLASTMFDKQITCQPGDLAYRAEDQWANYPKGIMKQLASLGLSLVGCDMLFHGNVPSGAGLSSSASIEMVTALAIASLAQADLQMIELVKLAQQVENQYIGVNCGIMDQFSVGMGKADHAVLLRCKTLEYRYVPLSLGDYQLVIINSNKRRELTESKYNERRLECEAGFALIQKYLPNATDLGSVRPEEWERVKCAVPVETIRKRLEHVVNENERVLQSTKALEAGNLQGFGQYMFESHESLRDLYEVTGAELDALFEEARRVEGCIGSRMTGAGFGGCTVSLVHREQVATFQQQVTAAYQKRTGLIPDFYKCEIGDGTRELKREAEAWPF